MNSKKKVLITGSNGMLGKDIEYLFQSSDEFEVFGINRTVDKKLDSNHSIACDITNFKELDIILNRIIPDIIIHCAANINVDGCEQDKEYAYKLNVKSTNILSSYNPNSTKFIYISTDSVFDGKDGNYSEQNRTNPLNYYAITKFQGEQIALENNKNTIVIRTNIYGFHKSEGNSLVEWALKNLKNLNEISGFNDVYFNPLYTKQLAKIIINLVKRDFKGIIHTGCDEFITKNEFLIELAKKFKLNTMLINGVSVETKIFNATRPKNTTLCTDELKSLINFEVSISQGLEELYYDYQEIRGDY